MVEAQQSVPPVPPLHTRCLRHEAEVAATSLGLVHGKHGAARLARSAEPLPGAAT